MRARLALLERENAVLRERVAFFERHPTLHAGIRGEAYVAALVRGHVARPGSCFDVTAATGARVEVKFSKLSPPLPGRPHTRRWAWGKLLGESGAKVFDYLLLLAEPDERYRACYRDPAALYVMFLVPSKRVRGILQRNGRHVGVQFTTNPATVTSRSGRLLLDRYQVAESELRKALAGNSRGSLRRQPSAARRHRAR